MPRRAIKILGINPGTRYLGVAVFEEAELLDWGVKVIKGRWSKAKMDKALLIVSELIKQHEPRVLAIKKLRPSRTSLHLARLADRIRQLSRRKGLKVRRYSIGELEAFFSPEERINKMGLAEIIASQYPALVHEHQREKSHKNSYHLRMFEAVALGAMCFHQLDK